MTIRDRLFAWLMKELEKIKKRKAKAVVASTTPSGEILLPILPAKPPVRFWVCPKCGSKVLFEYKEEHEKVCRSKSL